MKITIIFVFVVLQSMVLSQGCGKKKESGKKYYHKSIEAGLNFDKEKAWKYLTKSCDLKYGFACFSMGYQYVGGKSLGKRFQENDIKACMYYKKACDYNEALGCSYLGCYYNIGAEGIPKDRAIANEYFRKACELGDNGSCEILKNNK
jgi:uncharacterized protein